MKKFLICLIVLSIFFCQSVYADEVDDPVQPIDPDEYVANKYYFERTITGYENGVGRFSVTVEGYFFENIYSGGGHECYGTVITNMTYHYGQQNVLTFQTLPGYYYITIAITYLGQNGATLYSYTGIGNTSLTD
ncbi:MAG: hypothetical protein IKH73_03785 [Erysipelotrichaceae bacterium]|nr:hypothetical protein [Erysipelotrichaceae bacterium]